MKAMTRRGFLRVSGVAALGAATMLVGCGESKGSSSSAATSSSAANTSSSSAASPSTTAEGDALVLVFSRADENYRVGTVEVGNTMVLAQIIAEKTGADLFELERVEPYPEGYDACCDEAKSEQKADSRPELKALPDISGYSVVYFGFPCWWGDMPMPVYTAIEALDWNGKTICPFNTHEGSGEAGMFTKLAQKCTGATITSGLTMTGATAQNDRTAAASQVDSWLSKLGI